MVLLVLFAFVAGAGTALSPCVLPVLPAVLSAGATGGRRRPLGVVVGLAATFTVTIVGFGAVVDGVGLGDSDLRTLAAVVLLAFGIALVVPRLGALLEGPLSRLPRVGPRGRGDGLRSGLLVGAALGLAYAPCAGPILAAVITVSAAAERTLPIALAYSAGSACVLLALALGGRRVAGRVRRAGRGPVVQRALGAVMVLTAVAVAADLDVRFQTALATSFPSRSSTPRARSSAPVRSSGGSPICAARRGSRPPPLPTQRRFPPSAARPTSRAPSAGSALRASARCRSPDCAGRSCSSTSGPTRASTASARCRT